jgi:homoserine O-acetyltransferase
MFREQRMTTVTQSKFFTFAEDPTEPFVLKSGELLRSVTLAYETYGTLNADGSNAIVLFHALTGSQHAAGFNGHLPEAGEYWREECHNGWWDSFIGPGRFVDTERFFVVCANHLGGCYGSTGPASTNPATGRLYGGSFPHVSINDMVDAHLKLLDHLGVTTLHAAIGGSFGGLVALNLATRYPERVNKVISLASGMRVPVLQRIQNFEQICAIESDSHFNRGDFYEGERPYKGLALARMMAHKNYISLELISDRAKTELVSAPETLSCYPISYQVESYMFHQGAKFVRRFDANTYLRILEAWQHFDLASDLGVASVAEAFARLRGQQHLIFSIESDVCFWPEQQVELADYLKEAEVFHQHITVHSDKGHDAFLLEPALFGPHLKHFVEDLYASH